MAGPTHREVMSLAEAKARLCELGTPQRDAPAMLHWPASRVALGAGAALAAGIVVGRAFRRDGTVVRCAPVIAEVLRSGALIAVPLIERWAGAALDRHAAKP